LGANGSGILQHKNVFSYSGGTEATALYPMAAQTLEQSGFKIRVIAAGNNPIYSIKYAENTHPVIGFSKKYDDEFNLKSEFAVTCSQADGGCPLLLALKSVFQLHMKIESI
jgi:arsenate reductase